MKAKTRLLVPICLALACALWSPPARGELRGRQLRYDDAEIRTYLEQNMPAVPTKPLPPQEEDIRMISEIFEKGDRAEAERLAWVLGDWAGPLNTDMLVKASASQWPEVRAQAASSLAMLGPVLQGQARERVARELTRLLTDEDRGVVLAALWAVGRLRAASALNAAARHVSSEDPEIAAAALGALGEIGEPDSFAHVQKGLAAPNVDVVLAAVEATGRLRNPALAGHLVDKLRAQSPAVRVAAIRAIVALKAAGQEGELLALMDDPHGYIRREALKGLVELWGAKHEKLYLSCTEDADHTVRRVAAQALGQFRLRSGIDRLYGLFADPHLYVRDDAVIALAQMGDEKVIELAGEGLKSPTDTVRASSSQLLGRLKSDLNLQAHIALLKDGYLPARQWAAWALGETGRKEACAALNERAFAADEDNEVKFCAMVSLGKLGAVEALPTLEKLAAAKGKGEGTNEPLLSLRLAAVRAVGLLKQEIGTGVLIGRLTDEDPYFRESPEIKFESAVALGRIGSQQAVAPLDTYMKRWGSQKLRHACKWALTRIQGKAPDYDVPAPDNPAPDYFVQRLPPRTKAPGAQ